MIAGTGKTRSEIAGLLGIWRQHLDDILNERKPVSPTVAVRLGKLFGDGAGVWARMQSAYDTWHAERDLSDEIRKIPQSKRRWRERKEPAREINEFIDLNEWQVAGISESCGFAERVKEWSAPGSAKGATSS